MGFTNGRRELIVFIYGCITLFSLSFRACGGDRKKYNSAKTNPLWIGKISKLYDPSRCVNQSGTRPQKQIYLLQDTRRW